MRLGRIESLREEATPIIRCDSLQRFDDVIEGIRFNDRLAVIAAEKSSAKILEASFTFGLFSNDAVGFEPEEDAFIVIIAAAAPGVTRKDRMNLRSQRRVCEGPPSASGTPVQFRRRQGQILSILLRRPQAAACI